MRILVKIIDTKAPTLRGDIGELTYLDALAGTRHGSPTDNWIVGAGYSPVPGIPPGALRQWRNSLFTVEAVAEQAPPAYPDGNPKSLQGAKKYSLRYLPLPANIEVNRAFENGAEKYGAANWREKGVAASVYADAALRHLHQWFDGGQERAEDSDVHNLGHAMACLAIIIDAQANGTLKDDRPFACKDTDALLKREEKKDETAV